MSRSNKLVVKFRLPADPSVLAAKIRSIIGQDLREARPLFPGENEPELALLFEVDLRQKASLKRALHSLNKDKQIEYAHVPAARRPL